MVLALKCGIDSEIAWALSRLCRISANEQFLLRALPGLIEGLFEWPLWYARGAALDVAAQAALFSLPKDIERYRQHALESVFVLRNASLNPQNAGELSARRATQELILLALHRLKPDNDANVEFLLDVIDILQAIASTSILPPPNSPLFANPVPPLLELAGSSSNRSLIISSLTTLHLLFSNPPNVGHMTPDSPALSAAIRYLPLLSDKPLLDASLNFLYTQLSYTPMTKAFLQSKELTVTLRMLVLFMLNEEEEETVVVEIASPVYTAPATVEGDKDHVLTQKEFDKLLPMPEPDRCYEWMRTMFEVNPDRELTQVEFYNMYKDTFIPYQSQYYCIPASEVIKNVTTVFSTAQAMVLAGPPQKFVVRGVDRKKDVRAIDRFKCRWNQGQCENSAFNSTGELYEHVLEEHINPHAELKMTCSWANCSHGPIQTTHMRGHVLTHLPAMQQPARDPQVDDLITLPAEHFPHPVPDPTTRPVPPPRHAAITYTQPAKDPTHTALTALLCIRILFRASFASSAAAPRVDEEHFGFPGIIEDVEEKEGDEDMGGITDSEREGERRGRKAFVSVRHLLEGVRLRDDTLQGWIAEMVDAGLSGTT
ncbi:uncharacterized protein PHACADRAFT_111789 [Phanerochaete carnosa HHB-10118-sp]|uniref:RFX-type winged-helix domain-containing protein n=1 Tax=Phanerochaete carnosa (strain HHB-10118-sp) TaxID=650164 RepID=K5VEC2_PHACS|nr:uncharacterized protein PHACADRAFT_111789 [Phanerochaete carnosa HHB-10118-sp]EKM61321.1 hypothetical protein PHACADRAFT_111789 [Phanerochaete carnosa HHB-10118-sp]